MRGYRIRLSDWLHHKAHGVRHISLDTSRVHRMPLRLRLEVTLSLEILNLVRCFQDHVQSPYLVSVKSIPEVRSLSSAANTRHQRYYAPLRLPPEPTSNTLLLVATPHPGRVSHVTQNTFLTCCPHYPGGPEQVGRLRPCSAAAFPEYRAGRRPRLSFRGLLRIHSRYGLPGCCSPCGLHRSPELQQEDLSNPLSGLLPGCTDNFPDGTYTRWHLTSSWRTYILWCQQNNRNCRDWQLCCHLFYLTEKIEDTICDAARYSFYYNINPIETFDTPISVKLATY